MQPVLTRNPPLSMETFYKCFSFFTPFLVIKILLLWLNPCSGQKKQEQFFFFFLSRKKFNLTYFHNSKQLFQQNRMTPPRRKLIPLHLYWTREPDCFHFTGCFGDLSKVTWATLWVPTPWLHNGDKSIYLAKMGYKEIILLTRVSVNFRLTDSNTTSSVVLLGPPVTSLKRLSFACSGLKDMLHLYCWKGADLQQLRLLR